MPNATRQPAQLRHARTRSTAVTRRQLDSRDGWLQEIAPTSLFHTLFDHLPGLHFFAKNQRGEIMFLSSSIRERYGLRDDASAVGLTDFDINPHGMAESYVSDDARIYATGEPMSGRVELWWDAQGVPNWYVVTKLPIWSRRGRIIGVMGVIQEYEGHARFHAPWREIAVSVKYIRQHFRKQVTISTLAEQAGLSIRQLQRRFRAVLRLTPQEFLIKTRVLAACRALRESDASLLDIASACGFYDQSSFTEHFRRHTGQTPLAYRRQILRRATQTSE
ncbi:helix-turn-helix domain-containing protein [Roseimicrobium sp. ORNL1]|uniref:AraC family transcriptional regulator n=1 Tax=Roseimicrobium sp. ORNL1 TaxID=2711231 RepID=UPI0013E15788|nr:helix-turn-helix domain-containing protein [Roseimicrobium sp. ORNL1]QIF00016.1 AraC family transcriptional regulator [Roseimicrobium sp. ORNL1]